MKIPIIQVVADMTESSIDDVKGWSKEEWLEFANQLESHPEA